jgi:hypothetical protein
VSELEELLASAREKLTGAPRERLGSVREPGRIRRAVGGRAVIAPVAEAWHVGVLLIGEEALWRTGSVLRASEEVRRGYTAESQRERAAIRGMAFRGGFAEGETFHYDWAPVSGPDDAPLTRDGERIMVRWSPAGFLMPLGDYLDEQIALAR